MLKTRTLADQIESAREEIRQRENRLKELVQKQKTQERNSRTRRLCERGGYLESILPNTIPLSLEQFKTFLNKTLKTDFAGSSCIIYYFFDKEKPAQYPMLFQVKIIITHII